MIIPIYFPPYEDELFYSWICRLAEANGMALVDFGRIYLRTNNKRIMNSVTFEGIYWAIEKWDVHPDILDILLKHTVLVTEQQREINEKQKRNQYIFPRNLQAFLYNRGENEFYDAPGIVGKNQHKIRICTECLKKDIENGREAYIRTYHCLNGIDMCPVHKCPLMEINGFPNHDVTGKLLSTDEESLQRSQEKYELYKNTISMETENVGAPDTDSYRVNCKKGPILVAECKTCGTIFYTSQYTLDIGRDCPVCELKQNVLKKMLAVKKDYELIKDIDSLQATKCFMHVPCGQIVNSPAYEVIWKNTTCACVKHIKRNKFIKDSIAVRSDEFDKKVYRLTGDEYKRIGPYRKSSFPVKMYHARCGDVFMVAPGKFLNGKRCECVTQKLSGDELLALMKKEFVQNYEILTKKDGRYNIRFYDTGKTVKLESCQIIQEITCLCEPKYFIRKKEVNTTEEKNEYKKVSECQPVPAENVITDLTEKRFHSLVAVERLPDYKRKGKTYYKCKCDCGNEKIVSEYELTSNAVRSCGCLSKKNENNHRRKDLCGKRFGRLLAIERIPNYKNRRKTYYRCICDCGNETIVDGNSLSRGSTKSCGCLPRRKQNAEIKSNMNKSETIIR